MTPYDTRIVALNGSMKSIKYSDFDDSIDSVSYTHLDVYKRQIIRIILLS